MIYRILLSLVLVLVTASASADDEAVFKYRKGVMKAIGGQMASIGASMKGQVFTENLATHATAMAAMAEIAPVLFPKGSGVAKSEALPAIWEKPAEFKARMDDFVSAARDFEKLAKAGDMSGIVGGVKNLGKSCKGCHDDFREEKKH